MGNVTSGERSINVTMTVAVHDIGNHVPLMLTFSGVHFKDHMKIAALASYNLYWRCKSISLIK
jgi:hypothetical protein